MIASDQSAVYTTESAVNGLSFATVDGTYLLPGVVRVYTKDGETFRVFMLDQ
jgi:hypothetical protein